MLEEALEEISRYRKLQIVELIYQIFEFVVKHACCTSLANAPWLK